MPQAANSTIVTVADRVYFPGALMLVASLRYFQVRTLIHVLSMDLTGDQVALLQQFPGTQVFGALPGNRRTPATRRAEAIATARRNGTEYITVVDADCLATGDVSEYLTPPGPPAIYLRLKSDEEDRRVFAARYDRTDWSKRPHPVIPHRVLAAWRRDVGQNGDCAIRNTCSATCLTIHCDYMGFVDHWRRQLLKVLPDEPGPPHNWDYFAYFQTDESVLNSLLAFAADAPPVRRGLLDRDPSAHIAHLGPNRPKPWVCWRGDRLQYLTVVHDCIHWAKLAGYRLPHLPWSYREFCKPAVYTATTVFESYRLSRRIVRRIIDFATARR